MFNATSYHPYPKIYNMGHRYLAQLFDGDVHVQEKVDGSQFSFGVFDGVVKCRSKGSQININEPQKLFRKAIDTVLRLVDEQRLVDGWTYRGEVIDKPKHNTLEYEREPVGNIILFDVNIAEEDYIKPDRLSEIAHNLGLEVVPTLFYGHVTQAAALETLLGNVSILGKVKIEGIVCKNYDRFGVDKKVLMGKFVSPDFREKHQKDWKAKNPSQKDVLFQLSETYRHENRWKKAMQAMRDADELTGTPQDIAKLCKLVQGDVKDECADEIKEALFRWGFPSIQKRSVAGLAEWYKDILLNTQSEEGVSV